MMMESVFLVFFTNKEKKEEKIDFWNTVHKAVLG